MTIVVAAVEDSVAAGPVVAAALAIAPLLGSSVEAVHVGEAGGSTARELAERAGVAFRTVPGEPLARLVELASDGVTAVVVGTRDRPTAEAPVGHMALALADALPRPLLVVPPQCAPAERIRRVLVALEGTPGRAKPLRHALQVVAGADLDLTVVHVESEDAVPSFSESAAHETAEFAQEFLRRYWPDAPKARLALPIGSVADEILALADDVRPDVLVAGWPQGSGAEHGHVVREVLRRSACPVLLVAVVPLPSLPR
ncbi:MAG: universal stress protein [Mycobacteriales bacterium]